MNLIFPVLVVLCAAILLVKVATLAYDTAIDMLTQPFNPRYMTTWIGTFVLALSVMGLLGYLAYFMLTKVIPLL